MKRKILVIHNGYPLRGDGGDKVRTLNMLQSLDSIGFDVCSVSYTHLTLPTTPYV